MPLRIDQPVDPQCRRHGATWTFAVRIRLGKMMIIGGKSVTNDLTEDRRSAIPRDVEVLERENCRAFPEHHPGAISIKR